MSPEEQLALPEFKSVELRYRYCGGLAVRLALLEESNEAIVEVRDDWNPKSDDGNFYLNVADCLALKHPDNPTDDPTHIFWHPFAYREAFKRLRTKTAANRPTEDVRL